MFKRILVPLDGSGSSDIDSSPGTNDDIVSFEWYSGYGTLAETLLGTGESRLFLNASGKHPAMPQNADWAAGRLRSLVIPASGGGSGPRRRRRPRRR